MSKIDPQLTPEAPHGANALVDTNIPQSDAGVNGQNVATEGDGLGAANAGFTTPTRGEMVETQNKTFTQGVGLTEAERAALAPVEHEQVTAQMSGERAATMFYQDENGNFVNLEDTVDTLLEKESWTGAEQDAAQVAFRAFLQEVRNGNNEHLEQMRSLGRAIEEIGGSEAGRSLQARQKWIESGEGIVSKTATILEDPRIPENNIGSYANNQAKAEYYGAHDIEKDVSTNIVDKALAAKAEADIPFVTYMEYSAARSNVTYEQGVNGAKKEAVMAVIDALDLTKEQKDWLYFAEGYTEKTIGDAPWHGKG